MGPQRRAVGGVHVWWMGARDPEQTLCVCGSASDLASDRDDRNERPYGRPRYGNVPAQKGRSNESAGQTTNSLRYLARAMNAPRCVLWRRDYSKASQSSTIT